MVSALPWAHSAAHPGPLVEATGNLSHVLEVLVSYLFLSETGSWRNLLFILALP